MISIGGVKRPAMEKTAEADAYSVRPASLFFIAKRPLNATIHPVPEIAPKAVYSREEVRRLLDVTERQLRGWEKHRLIPPMERFGFSDLIALRTLIKLRESRIPPARIRNVLSALRERLNDINDPLKELRLISDGKRIHVQVGEHSMEPVSGQLLFNFDPAELKRLVSFPHRKKTEESRGRANQLRSGSSADWNANRREQFRTPSRRTRARSGLILRRPARG